MQRDPLGYVDGMNLMEYVGGNPINLTDPFGFEGNRKGEGEDRRTFQDIQKEKAEWERKVRNGEVKNDPKKRSQFNRALKRAKLRDSKKAHGADKKNCKTRIPAKDLCDCLRFYAYKWSSKTEKESRIYLKDGGKYKFDIKTKKKHRLYFKVDWKNSDCCQKMKKSYASIKIVNGKEKYSWFEDFRLVVVSIKELTKGINIANRRVVPVDRSLKTNDKNFMALGNSERVNAQMSIIEAISPGVTPVTNFHQNDGLFEVVVNVGVPCAKIKISTKVSKY